MLLINWKQYSFSYPIYLAAVAFGNPTAHPPNLAPGKCKVLKSDGNSELGAHVRSDFGQPICSIGFGSDREQSQIRFLFLKKNLYARIIFQVTITYKYRGEVGEISRIYFAFSVREAAKKVIFFSCRTTKRGWGGTPDH